MGLSAKLLASVCATVLAAAACDDAPPGDGATDAAAPRADAAPGDGAAPGDDAAEALDATTSSTSADAQTPADDAASPSTDDAASTADDAQASADDAAAPRPDGGTFVMTPPIVTVALGAAVELSVGSPAGTQPSWRVDGVPLGNAELGLLAVGVDPRGAVYTAPEVPRVLPPVSHVVSATVGAASGEAIVELVYAAPTIAAVAPSALDADTSTTPVTVTGTGFVPVTRADIDGAPAAVRWRSPTELVVDVPTARLRYPGTARLILFNPTPGGGAVSAALTIVLRRAVLPPGLHPSVPGLFDAANVGNDPLLRPVITYPEPDAVAPRDFPAPTVSWRQPAPLDVCRMRLSGPTAVVDVFTSTAPRPPSQNPQAVVPSAVWVPMINAAPRPADLAVEVTCAQVRRPPGQPLAIAGNTVHRSASRNYRVASELATGHIAYFSGSIQGLARIDVSPTVAPPAPWVGPGPNFALNTNYCVGCHSFSQSGDRMSFTAIIGGVQANLGALDLSGPTPALAFQGMVSGVAEWTSLHPAGQVILSQNTAGILSLYSAQNGAFITQVPTTTHARSMTQPAWAGDGQRLAFTGTNQPQTYGAESVQRGSIYTMTYSNAGGVHTFGPVRRVADSGGGNGNSYYPSFSPDGQWIAFCRAAAGGESYNNPDGRIWLVKADGTVGPILLGRASQARAGNTNSWPRWSPLTNGGRYYLMFSSVRDYPPLVGAGPQQLWVTQIDTNQLPGDPSSPAVWLSGQDPFTVNLTAEWTQSL